MLEDGIPVIDLGSDCESNNNSCDCGNCGSCGCEDNVVEFGYDDTFVESTDDDNVIEF